MAPLQAVSSSYQIFTDLLNIFIRLRRPKSNPKSSRRWRQQDTASVLLDTADALLAEVKAGFCRHAQHLSAMNKKILASHYERYVLPFRRRFPSSHITQELAFTRTTWRRRLSRLLLRRPRNITVSSNTCRRYWTLWPGSVNSVFDPS